MLNVKAAIILIYMIFPIGCSRNDIGTNADPSVTVLMGLSESTANHFAALIRNFGTEKCRYSDKTNQDFWDNVRGDLQIVNVWSASENPRANREILIPLQAAYRDAERLEELVDAGAASRTVGGAPLYCIEPETAVLQTKNLVPTVNRMIKAISNN